LHKACIAFTIYYGQGKIDLAYRASEEALRLAEESGDILSKTEAHINHGVCCYGKGFLDEAEEHLLKGRKFAESANLFSHTFVANLFLGLLYSCRGEYRKAQDYYNDAMSVEKFGILGPSFFNLTRIALASAKVMNNEKDIALRTLYAYASENKVKRFAGSIKRHIGEILLNVDDEHIPEAEQWVMQAIEADKRHGMMFELGMDYALYAQLFRRKGDQSKAKENLNKAIEIYKECGADGWVKKAEQELASIS